MTRISDLLHPTRPKERAKPDDFLGFWNHWLLGHDPDGKLDHARDEFGATGRDFVAYAYADHEAGLSLQLECFCRVRRNGAIEPTFNFWAPENRISYKLRFDTLDWFRLRVLTHEEIAVLQLPDEPDWVSFYTNEDLESVRRMAILRPLRAPHHPDDIRAVVGGTKGKEPEVVWVRTERLLENGDIEAVLLNQPNQKLGVNRGDHVALRVREVPQGVESILVGRSRGRRFGLGSLFNR